MKQIHITVFPVGSDAGELRDILMTNVLGPFLVTHALLPLIRKGTQKQVSSSVADCMCPLSDKHVYKDIACVHVTFVLREAARVAMWLVSCMCDNPRRW